MRTVWLEDDYDDEIRVQRYKNQNLRVEIFSSTNMVFSRTKSSTRALRKLIAALKTGLAELEAK